MLPPVDPAVLQRNPNFEVLYTDLTTRKLNPNGSTRDTKKQRVHDEIRRALTKAYTDMLSTQILTTALSDLPSRSPDLPADLYPVIDLTSALLHGHIPLSDRPILSGDLSYFDSNLSTISASLSTYLTTLANYLCSIATPLDDSQPSPDMLCTRATSLQEAATQTLPQDLQSTMINLTNSLTHLLSTHTSLLTSLLTCLEQTQHGALARHSRATADLVHTRATLLGLQAKVHTFAHPPPEEFVRALREFKRVQGSGEKALRDREALAKRELELYERAGKGGMKDLAARKEWLGGVIGRTEREIEKLGEGV